MLPFISIYFTGCAGDTTAGKYNTGARDNRPVLAQRLYGAMAEAWQKTRRQPLKQAEFRVAELRLPARSPGKFTPEALRTTLANTNATRPQANRNCAGDSAGHGESPVAQCWTGEEL